MYPYFCPPPQRHFTLTSVAVTTLQYFFSIFYCIRSDLVAYDYIVVEYGAASTLNRRCPDVTLQESRDSHDVKRHYIFYITPSDVHSLYMLGISMGLF